MAFNFPDPTVEQVVKNPETGIVYKWLDDPGKWIIETLSDSTIREIVWEGDSPPDPIGEYKFWYSTDTLELYFHYCDAIGTCAWVPTSAPITMLEDLNTTVAVQSNLIQEQIARINALEAAVFSTP